MTRRSIWTIGILALVGLLAGLWAARTFAAPPGSSPRHPPTPLVPPHPLSTGFGGLCETTNSGDPVALYDSMADRWVLTWFAFSSQSGPTFQCVAVSAGPDPLGNWYRYSFQVGNGFEDYPHMTVWPDAYY